MCFAANVDHLIDIYTSSIYGRPAFVKSDMLDMGEKYEGLTSEWDVEKHRAAWKQLAPAFSPRALREYQPRTHEHVNQLLLKLEEIPVKDDGFNIVLVCIPMSQLESSAAGKLIDDAQWFERVTADLGGAIAVNHDFNNVRDGKRSPILSNKALSCSSCRRFRMVEEETRSTNIVTGRQKPPNSGIHFGCRPVDNNPRSLSTVSIDFLDVLSPAASQGRSQLRQSPQAEQ